MGSLFFVLEFLEPFLFPSSDFFVFLGRTLVTWGCWSFLAECLGKVLCSDNLLGGFSVFEGFMYLLAQIWVIFTCVI